MIQSCLRLLVLVVCLMLGACGGGGGGGESDTENSASAPSSGNAQTSSNTSGSSASSNPSIAPTPVTGPVPVVPSAPTAISAAGKLAGQLSRSSQLQVGLGAGNEMSAIQSQALDIDILDRYLPFTPGSSWVYNWGWSDRPDGYLDRVLDQSDQLGAVPMFTLYQFTYLGEANMAILSDREVMSEIWFNMGVLFDRLGRYGKPALVHFEPDLWGYIYRAAPDQDPTRLYAEVQIEASCADLPNHVAGMVACMIRMARQRAPASRVGFAPSNWGFGTDNVVAYMNALGADQADMLIMQTLDRDAGCFEAVGPACTRNGNNWFWDHQAFSDHFEEARQYHEGIGGLPLLWWQTPMGVNDDNPGGSPGAWRDNRVESFLGDPQRLVDAGGFGVVFSAGAVGQTTINTDGGHFQLALRNYQNTPALLP